MLIYKKTLIHLNKNKLMFIAIDNYVFKDENL